MWLFIYKQTHMHNTTMLKYFTQQFLNMYPMPIDKNFIVD